MKIIAIVVTFNRPTKLDKSIRSIYKGDLIPDEIIVVNNCSTDDTNIVLEKLASEFRTLVVIETKENIGGAGGFTIGLKAAYERQASHFWLLDDDAYSTSNTLKNLTDCYNELNKTQTVGFLCSRVLWTNGELCVMNQPVTSSDWMRVYRESLPVMGVKSCSFVSCYLSREVLEQVGLPFMEFFIWFDDFEFTHRVSKLYPSYAVLSSTVIHDTPVNEGVSFAEVDDENLWKYCFGALNKSWYKSRRESFFHWLYFWGQINQQMRHGRVSVKNKFIINYQMLKGPFRKLIPKNVRDFAIEDFVKLQSDT